MIAATSVGILLFGENLITSRFVVSFVVRNDRESIRFIDELHGEFCRNDGRIVVSCATLIHDANLNDLRW